MAYRYRRWLCAACLVGSSVASSLVGCNDDSDDDPVTEPDAGVEMQDVELHFEARVGDQPVACDATYAGLGKNQRSVSLGDLRWYVYDVKLIDDSGKAVDVTLPDDEIVQWKQVALLDFEDASGDCSNGSSTTNFVLNGKVPAGDYSGVSFGIGMPPDLNHANLAEQKAPLSLSSLWWGWQGGHKFFRLDLRLVPEEGKAGGGFDVHVGSTGCTGEPGSYSCSHENTPHIQLDAFDAARDAIVLDLEPLLADTELRSAAKPGDIVGCTSQFEETDCETLLPKFGLNVDTGKPSGTQTIFRVEAR